MRILMITDTLPYPLIGGDRIRIYNLLRRVASRHEVSLASLIEKPDEAFEGVPHLQQFCVRVETANYQRRKRLAYIPGMLGYAIRGNPPELYLLHSEELESKIKQLVSTTDFDIVQIESRMGLYLDLLPVNGHFKSVLMFQNFTFQQDNRVFHIERQWTKKIRPLINSIAMHSWEPRHAERFTRCTTVSEIDQQFLQKANSRLRINVIPNGVDIQNYKPLPENAQPVLMFVGNMGYPPCADAVLYFCQEILPLIRRKIAAVEMWIVGRNPRPEVLQLDGDGVHITGQVGEVLPYYQRSAVCVVPLRAGGGTRLKILEAMALGRPVVSTTIGCEGLDVVDGEHLMVADDPEQFAEKTVRLLTDRGLYQDITANGRQLVETHYDWDIISGQLMDMYAEM